MIVLVPVHEPWTIVRSTHRVQEVSMSFTALPLGSLVALGAVFALWMSSGLLSF